MQEVEAQRRREDGEPLLRVPITSELGNVTPAFLVPGEWEQESVAKVAQLIAYNMLDNAGCNCLTPRVVVMAADWPQVRLLPPPPLAGFPAVSGLALGRGALLRESKITKARATA